MLVSAGFPESALWDWPLDKFYLVVEALQRRQRQQRRAAVQDTAAAIGVAFSREAAAAFHTSDSDE